MIFDLVFFRCMNDLQFYILFNSISVMPGQWAGDNERLCAMELCLQLKRSPPQTRTSDYYSSKTARGFGHSECNRVKRLPATEPNKHLGGFSVYLVQKNATCQPEKIAKPDVFIHHGFGNPHIL